MSLPLVVAITGASGVIYGVELLKVLQCSDVATHLILSESAGHSLAIETHYSIAEVRLLADVVYNNKEYWGSSGQRLLPDSWYGGSALQPLKPCPGLPTPIMTIW